LGEVPAQVIVGLGVSGGTIRPRPAEAPPLPLLRTVVGTVRLVGTNADQSGPKVVIVAVCESTIILIIALPSIRTAEAVEPKVIFAPMPSGQESPK